MKKSRDEVVITDRLSVNFFSHVKNVTAGRTTKRVGSGPIRRYLLGVGSPATQHAY